MSTENKQFYSIVSQWDQLLSSPAPYDTGFRSMMLDYGHRDLEQKLKDHYSQIYDVHTFVREWKTLSRKHDYVIQFQLHPKKR